MTTSPESTMSEEPRKEGGHVIPLAEPHLGGNEWAYLKECVETNWVSSAGSFVDQFEATVGDYLGGRHAVALASGTAALHTALLLAGVGRGDEVLLPTLTFIAPANAVRYTGAHPVFVDCEPETWQMDPALVAEFLEERCRREDGEVINEATGRHVRAILPVHILGHPCDMDPLLDIAEDYDLVVIEDAAESLGAEYKGRKVGTLADIACLSFNGNKTVTAGGGGMVVTDRKSWADRARYLTTQAKHDDVEYIHNEIGYNYRLTNLQAAVGCAQMEELNTHVEAKREIASHYRREIEAMETLDFFEEANWARSTYWLSAIQLTSQGKKSVDRRELQSHMRKENVHVRPLWQPLHKSPAHENSMVLGGAMAQATRNTALCLPSSVGLASRDQETVIEMVGQKTENRN